MHFARLLAILLPCWVLSYACQKEQTQEHHRLLNFTDKNFKYGVHYKGRTITSITVDSGAQAPYTIASYSYQVGYIRADLHPNTGFSYVEYFLNNNLQPTRIRKYRRTNGADLLSTEVVFHYKAGRPDSVVLTNTSRFCFIPKYNGNNISDYYLRVDNRAAILSGSFLYYSTANIFTNTNPLLFVYSSPSFEFEAFLLPRLFSQQTLQKFNGGAFVYDLDEKGNLSLEDYGTTIYPYRRTYLYE